MAPTGRAKGKKVAERTRHSCDYHLAAMTSTRGLLTLPGGAGSKQWSGSAESLTSLPREENLCESGHGDSHRTARPRDPRHLVLLWPRGVSPARSPTSAMPTLWLGTCRTKGLASVPIPAAGPHRRPL